MIGEIYLCILKNREEKGEDSYLTSPYVSAYGVETPCQNDLLESSVGTH